MYNKGDDKNLKIIDQYNQIYNFFIKKLFHISQYGFRSNHSTEFSILEVVNRIIQDMDKNKVPIEI